MELIEFMIQKGATNWKWGLRGACEGGHMEMVELMIQKGADDLNRGLITACQGERMEMAELMIQKGATPGVFFPSRFIPYMLNHGIQVCICQSDLTDQASVFDAERAHEFTTRRHKDQVAIAGTLTPLLPVDVIKHVLILYIPFSVQIGWLYR